MYATKNTAHVLFSDPIAIRYSAYTSTGLGDPQDSDDEPPRRPSRTQTRREK